MSEVRKSVDMMGREVNLHFPPQCIVSLVPSQTEFLIDIGAPVGGRTKFCIHPKEKVSAIEVIGGTKKFRFDKIKVLNPDLIIGNKEENYREGVYELAKDFPVWMSDIYSLQDAFRMMKDLGDLCNLAEEASALIGDCQKSMERVKATRSGRVIYMIWKNPWLAAGKHTFIDHILSYLGYENAVTKTRYPELSDLEIQQLGVDHILLSSEPFPFNQNHLEETQSLWPDVSVGLVDGELFSWYGSRLKKWS